MSWRSSPSRSASPARFEQRSLHLQRQRHHDGPSFARARSLVVSNYGRKGAMPGPDISMPIAWLAGLLYGLSGKGTQSSSDNAAGRRRRVEALARWSPNSPRQAEAPKRDGLTLLVAGVNSLRSPLLTLAQCCDTIEPICSHFRHRG